MTEQTNFADVNAGSQDSSSSAAPITSSAPSSPSVSHETSSEQLLPQSKVNELVGKAKAEAYEKAKREAQATQQSQPQQMGGIAQVPAEELDRLIEQRLQEREQKTQSLQVANNFLQKLSQGEEKYNDFKEVMGSFNLHEFARTAPAVFHLVNSADNTADIMYELANNPKKIADLQYTAMMNPMAAQREIKALSESIKVNEAAKKQKAPQEPLSQIKPSSVGVDNGSMTVRDFKRDPLYRV